MQCNLEFNFNELRSSELSRLGQTVRMIKLHSVINCEKAAILSKLELAYINANYSIRLADLYQVAVPSPIGKIRSMTKG